MWIKRNIPSLLCIVIMLGASYYFHDSLPDQVPTRFDFNGDPLGHTSRDMVVWLMPLAFTGILLLTNILIRLSPKQYSMQHSRKALDVILFGVGLMILGIHLGMMIDPGPMAPDATITRFTTAGIAGFLILVGIMFGKSERNFFVGIRLPWTIASEANWIAAHRLAGKLMVASGLIILVSIPFHAIAGIAFALLAASLLIPCIYSLVYYLRREKPLE